MLAPHVSVETPRDSSAQVVARIRRLLPRVRSAVGVQPRVGWPVGFTPSVPIVFLRHAPLLSVLGRSGRPLLRRRSTRPNVPGVGGIIVLTPGAPDIRGRRMAPWGFIRGLRRRLSAVPQVRLPQIGSQKSTIVYARLPRRLAPGGRFYLRTRFRRPGHVPICVLVHVLLKTETRFNS